MKRRRWTLRRLVTFYGLSITVIALILFAVSNVVFEHRNIRENISREISTTSALLRQASASALAFNDPESLKHVFEGLKQQPMYTSASLYTREGVLFASYGTDQDNSPSSAFLEREGLFFGSHEVAYISHVRVSSLHLGTLVIKRSTADAQKSFLSTILTSVFIFYAALGITWFFMLLFRPLVTRPIENLNASVQQVSLKGDYTIRIREAGLLEIQGLVRSINDMLQVIEQSQHEARTLTAKLEQSRKDLTEKVKERTLELQKRSEQAENLNESLVNLLEDLQASNKQLEVAMRRLTETNKELETFSYSASHDLRAPLRAIDGFSQALLEDYGPQLNAEAQDYLNRVRGAAQRMGELIDDLLQLSRVSAKPLNRVRFNLSKIAEQEVLNLRKQDADRVAEIHIQSNMQVYADQNLLAIVLTNLLGNAWKFSSKQAKTIIHMGAQKQDDDMVYFVQDNGAGFDADKAERLFGAFQRMHAPSDFPGTGIGLATVRRIIHAHGGRVWAESKPKQGATFYFTLA